MQAAVVVLGAVVGGLCGGRRQLLVAKRVLANEGSRFLLFFLCVEEVGLRPGARDHGVGLARRTALLHPRSLRLGLQQLAIELHVLAEFGSVLVEVEQVGLDLDVRGLRFGGRDRLVGVARVTLQLLLLHMPVLLHLLLRQEVVD